MNHMQPNSSRVSRRRCSSQGDAVCWRWKISSVLSAAQTPGLKHSCVGTQMLTCTDVQCGVSYSMQAESRAYCKITKKWTIYIFTDSQFGFFDKLKQIRRTVPTPCKLALGHNGTFNIISSECGGVLNYQLVFVIALCSFQSWNTFRFISLSTLFCSVVFLRDHVRLLALSSICSVMKLRNSAHSVVTNQQLTAVTHSDASLAVWEAFYQQHVPHTHSGANFSTTDSVTETVTDHSLKTLCFFLPSGFMEIHLT